MAEKTTNHFYSEIPTFEDGLVNHISKRERFVSVPKDWHIIITDIKGSTEAVERGQHQQVNLVATASIISALNIAKEKNISFPFFFGGDGATLLVPDIMKSEVISALSVYQGNVKQAFDLDLRVDDVPVSYLYEKEQELTISKVKLNSKYTIPVVLGEGLLFADEVIKERRFDLKEEKDQNLLNLEGMECRWDAVKPPEKTKQVVCLLVKVQSGSNHGQVLSKLLKIIEDIYGSYEERRPISVQGLKLTASLNRFKAENELKFGEPSAKRLAKSVIGYVVGRVYLKRNSGKGYLKSLVELSDTLVLNGMLNTVISGTQKQSVELETRLTELEENGEIVYGANICSESIMSCYVQDRKYNHVHFIDGSEGGYTTAASVLKAKLSKVR
ncbi:MAG: DUF3095 family protein [Balneolaceae bacterium]